jgi:hypothetical protein
MDLVENWHSIRKHFNRSFSSNFHVSIASLGADNEPRVTPIGSLFLNYDPSGFYFEKFPSSLPKYAQINRTVCVLAVDSNPLFWYWSLLKGRFSRPPAIKLTGDLGDIREASKKEISLLQRRMTITSGTKGNRYLWGDMSKVRDLKFRKAEAVRFGEMTSW